MVGRAVVERLLAKGIDVALLLRSGAEERRKEYQEMKRRKELEEAERRKYRYRKKASDHMNEEFEVLDSLS